MYSTPSQGKAQVQGGLPYMYFSTYAHVYAYMHVYLDIHIYRYTYIFICMYTYIYIYIMHTHISTGMEPLGLKQTPAALLRAHPCFRRCSSGALSRDSPWAPWLLKSRGAYLTPRKSLGYEGGPQKTQQLRKGPYIYIYTYTHTCIHVYIYISHTHGMHVYRFIYLFTCRHTHVHMYVYICI